MEPKEKKKRSTLTVYLDTEFRNKFRVKLAERNEKAAPLIRRFLEKWVDS